jgi:hypothetical protein
MKYISLLTLFILIASVILYSSVSHVFQHPVSGAPPYGEAKENVLRIGTPDWIDDWTRPEGPPRVGLQAGHWKNDELPDELGRLRNNGGSEGGGKSEWEVNLTIVEETAALLRDKGVEVDILPATVPPSYWADAFVAIHADGSESASTTGFKIAGPWRDLTGSAHELSVRIERSYEQETGLSIDPNITRNMRGYYAFSWWRNTHAVHPMTTSAIVETGFLTNASDRNIIVDSPTIPAKGISDGILQYLIAKKLL